MPWIDRVRTRLNVDRLIAADRRNVGEIDQLRAAMREIKAMTTPPLVEDLPVKVWQIAHDALASREEEQK